jgi:hypothetical protein
MLPACWKNNRLEKSVIQIYTKNYWLKWLYTKKNSIWEALFLFFSQLIRKSSNIFCNYLLLTSRSQTQFNLSAYQLKTTNINNDSISCSRRHNKQNKNK